MKLSKVLLGVSLAVSCSLALAAKPAPVIEVTTKPSVLVEQLENLAAKLDARNRAQVKIQRQFDDLQNELNELRGVTELHTHQLTQVLQRQRELYQELDRRVNQALKPVAAVPDALVVPANNAATNYCSDLTENEVYDRAVNLVLKDKRYEQAIPEFRRFNEKYPESIYAANAHYWLGQLLFNKGELQQAEQEFVIVVEQYKDSAKRTDAMLKLAMVAQKLKQNDKAISLYRQLLKLYPESTAAQLAKPRLKSLLP